MLLTPFFLDSLNSASYELLSSYFFSIFILSNIFALQYNAGLDTLILMNLTSRVVRLVTQQGIEKISCMRTLCLALGRVTRGTSSS